MMPRFRRSLAAAFFSAAGRLPKTVAEAASAALSCRKRRRERERDMMRFSWRRVGEADGRIIARAIREARVEPIYVGKVGRFTYSTHTVPFAAAGRPRTYGDEIGSFYQ